MMITRLVVVITLQCIQTYRYVAHLTLRLYVNYTSIERNFKEEAQDL